MELREAYSQSDDGMKRVLPAQVEDGLQCVGVALPPLAYWLQNTPQTGDLRATRFKSPCAWRDGRSGVAGNAGRRQSACAPAGLRERSKAPT